MAITVNAYQLIRVTAEYVTADLIVWRTYKRRCSGVVEKMLDDNPHLAKIHKTTPFLPVGTLVRVPIDSSLMAGRPPAPNPNSNLWTDKAGMTL